MPNLPLTKKNGRDRLSLPPCPCVRKERSGQSVVRPSVRPTRESLVGGKSTYVALDIQLHQVEGLASQTSRRLK